MGLESFSAEYINALMGDYQNREQEAEAHRRYWADRRSRTTAFNLGRAVRLAARAAQPAQGLLRELHNAATYEIDRRKAALETRAIMREALRRREERIRTDTFSYSLLWTPEVPAGNVAELEDLTVVPGDRLRCYCGE